MTQQLRDWRLALDALEADTFKDQLRQVLLDAEGRINDLVDVQALEQARALGETATSRRTRREDRLRALGFEDPTNDERRERLARNVALKDWPKR